MIKLKSDKNNVRYTEYTRYHHIIIAELAISCFFYFALKQPSLENINPCVRYALHYSYKAQKYFWIGTVFVSRYFS